MRRNPSGLLFWSLVGLGGYVAIKALRTPKSSERAVEASKEQARKQAESTADVSFMWQGRCYDTSTGREIDVIDCQETIAVGEYATKFVPASGVTKFTSG